MQSTGGPVNTAIMGNWFGPKNRGYIFGCWTCHQYVGNIVAAIIASVVLLSDISWTWALLVPSVSNILWGFTCIFFLPERPESVGIELSESSLYPSRKIADRSRGVSTTCISPCAFMIFAAHELSLYGLLLIHFLFINRRNFSKNHFL